MKHAPKGISARKAPEASESHDEIDAWLRKTMPDLTPIVVRLDALIREIVPDLQFAVKFKKAHYGRPDVGWMLELVAYDVSVNVVFHSGGSFDAPPPLGEGDSRYIKVKSLEEVESPEMRAWIEQAARTPGWR